MKNLLFLLFGSLFLLSGCASSEDTPKQNYKQISQSEAAEILETEEEYILLDVRTPEEFAQGHIPGAVCIPNESITTKESPKELPMTKLAAPGDCMAPARRLASPGESSSFPSMHRG